MPLVSKIEKKKLVGFHTHGWVHVHFLINFIEGQIKLLAN